jgi:hypothetical protein
LARSPRYSPAGSHEIAHALGVGCGDYGRQRAEVLVDTDTHIVCSSGGIDVSGSGAPLRRARRTS